jgi:hypothetical protein
MAVRPAAQAPPPARNVAVPAVPSLTNCEPNMTRTDVLLMSDALPKNSKGLVDLLSMCSAEVQKLIQSGQFGFVYQPTMLGKDIALALEDHIHELPESQRTQAYDSIRRAVLSAWRLDLYGDLGNRELLSDAFKLFAAAITDIKTVYYAAP